MRTITTPIYEFDELDTEGRARVINETVQYIAETADPEDCSPEILRAIEEVDRLKTPWFLGEYIMDYAKAEVLELCTVNEYYYDGELYYERR